MEGISKARIEFGSEADQTGCIGCNQLENTRKPGGRFEQQARWRISGPGSPPPAGNSAARPSAWFPKPTIRTAAAGWMAGRSARTFLTRRRPRRKRWHGASRRSGAIGLASSSRGLCCPIGAPYSLPNEPHRDNQCNQCAVSGRDKQVTLSPLCKLM
jgi:hypothetical protein